MKVLQEEDQNVLNDCAKYLARNNTDARHNYGQFNANDERGRICGVVAVSYC